MSTSVKYLVNSTDMNRLNCSIIVNAAKRGENINKHFDDILSSCAQYLHTSLNTDYLNTWGYLDDSSWVPSVSLVAVGTLYKYGTLSQTLSKHLTPNIV